MGCQERHEAEVTHAVREEEEAEEAGPGAAQAGSEFHRRRFRTCLPGGGRARHRASRAEGSPGPVPPDDSEMDFGLLPSRDA